MFVIPANFIGNFKIGDNIVFNMNIVSALYQSKNSLEPDERNLLVKPIVTTLASICEAILYDFNFRINRHTIEGIPSLSDRVISAIRTKEYDEFEQLIACSKKHDFFEPTSAAFYDDLHKMRKIRNRIHIQNKKHDTPPDEHDLFSDAILRLAERCTEKIIRVMANKYPRSKTARGYVADLHIPWSEHFPGT